MNFEHNYLEAINNIRNSKDLKVDLLKSTILIDMESLVKSEDMSIDDSIKYFDYLYDKLENLEQNVDIIIQREIDNEIDKYLAHLYSKIKKQGIDNISFEQLRQKIIKDLNQEKTKKENSIEDIAYTLMQVKNVEIE